LRKFPPSQPELFLSEDLPAAGWWEDEAIHGNIQSSRFACNGPSFRQKAGFSEFEIFLAKGGPFTSKRPSEAICDQT
jgi:hypothetical protein